MHDDYNHIIGMHLNQIVIKFTISEKKELLNLMNGFGADCKEARPLDRTDVNKSDLEFKNNIVNFIKSKKNGLQDRNRCIERVREFLVEEKCIQLEQNNLLQSTENDSINAGIQKLRIKIAQMQKNNEVFELFIAFLEEMKDLRQDHIYEFEYKLSKATKLSRMERETLALVAKRLAKVDSLSKMNDVEDDITAFFSKITRYGIHQEFKELQRISHQQIRNKCFKLVQYLQNNCIELKQQFNPLRSLLKKLSISIYDKSEILANLAQLPQNIRLIFEPVCSEIFRLREGAMKTSFIGDTLMYVSHDMKKAQEQSFQSLKKEKEELKRKCTAAEEELKRTKFILEKLGHMSNLFRQEDLYSTIQRQLGNSSEQLKIYLQRIYNHLKSFQQLTLGARKASFIQRKDNEIEFLQEKLSIALQELDVLRSSKFAIQESQSLLMDQNSDLQDRTSQNQRIIAQYQSEMSSLNAQISTYSKQINKLSRQLLDSEKQIQSFLKEKSQLQKQIDRLMNFRKDEQAQQQNVLTIKNKQLQSEMKALKQENLSLLQKCQQKSAQHNELQQKTKQIASLKYLQSQNSHLVELINRLNNQIQQKQSVIKQQQQQQILIEKQDEFVQTFQQQSRQSSSAVEALTEEIKQLREQKEKLEFLKTQNAQLKQERFLILNEQKQMKRIYREQKADVGQIEDELASYRELCEKLTKDYDQLKKKHNELKLQQLERKIHVNKHPEQTDLQKENLKKMQEKHRLLERNFEQIKKYNELIKNQYHKLKQESHHTLKTKVKDIVDEYKQNQIKLKKMVENLTSKNTLLNSKISILQQQNLNLKVKFQTKPQKNDLSSLRQRQQPLTQSLNFTQQRQESHSQQKLRAELRVTKIKNQQDRIRMLNEIKTKEEQISSQRIQILKLEQKLDYVTTQLNQHNIQNQQPSEGTVTSSNGEQWKSMK